MVIGRKQCKQHYQPLLLTTFIILLLTIVHSSHDEMKMRILQIYISILTLRSFVQSLCYLHSFSFHDVTFDAPSPEVPASETDRKSFSCGLKRGVT